MHDEFRIVFDFVTKFDVSVDCMRIEHQSTVSE